MRLSYFVWGNPLIKGLAGMQMPPRLFGEVKPPSTDTALQLVAEYDLVRFSYAPTAVAAADAFAGDYGIDIITLGANYWLTKHVRLTANALVNHWRDRAARPVANDAYTYGGTGRVALAF